MFFIAFGFHQSRCLDSGCFFFMFNAWLVEVCPLLSLSSPLPFSYHPVDLVTKRQKYRIFLATDGLLWFFIFYFFWLFLKYLSSPRAIWALLIWTLKEQQVSWPALLTGKQRAWPKIHPLLSWIPLNPRTDAGRTQPSKSNLLSVGSGDGFWGCSTHSSCSTNTQCGSGADHGYTDDTFSCGL